MRIIRSPQSARPQLLRWGLLYLSRQSYHAGSTDGGSVTFLRNTQTGAELYLIGTAHVSRRSAEEVYEVINLVKPDTVAVELCDERARKLMAGEENQTKNLLLEFLKFPGGLGPKLVHIATKSVYSFLRNTGLEPGEEFKVAIEEAERLGASLVHIDQDFRVTVKRIADVMTLQDILKLLSRDTSDLPREVLREFASGDFVEGVERLKTRENVRRVIKGMEKLFPHLVNTLIHERDQLMARRLRECHGRVVGVVGMAHMDGIERIWRSYGQGK